MTEIAAWEAAVAATQERLAPLALDDVAAVTQAWLQGLDASCSAHVGRLLQQCRGAQELVALEQRVAAQQAAWTRALPMATRRSSRCVGVLGLVWLAIALPVVVALRVVDTLNCTL